MDAARVARAFGEGAYECVFEPGDRRGGERRVILMGLYPPAGSSVGNQHDNRTSKEIAAAAPRMHFDWVDLFPYAPALGCGAVDLGHLDSLVSERDAQAEVCMLAWHDRMLALVERETDHGNAAAVVVWAGATVNAARERLREMGRYEAAPVMHTPYARICKTATYVSVEGAVHPSAHLQARGEPHARALFADTYACVSELNRANHVSTDSLYEAIGADRKARRDLMVRALTLTGIPHVEGWLHQDLRHLRAVPWGVDGLIERVVYFKEECGHESFLKIIRRNSVAARLHDPSFLERLAELMRTLGKDKFVTFMSDSVAARLHDPAFLERVAELMRTLGKDKFVTFMSGSVAARLHDPAYLEWFHTLVKSIGPYKSVSIASLNGVSCRWRCFVRIGSYVALHMDWTREMSAALCRRVPKNATSPVEEATFDEIYRDCKLKRKR